MKTCDNIHELEWRSAQGSKPCDIGIASLRYLPGLTAQLLKVRWAASEERGAVLQRRAKQSARYHAALDWAFAGEYVACSILIARPVYPRHSDRSNLLSHKNRLNPLNHLQPNQPETATPRSIVSLE